MVIYGEVKDKIYGMIADSIDVMRLYRSAIEMWKKTKEELAALVEENDRLRDEKEVHQEAAEKACGQVAALEHMVTELEERNDRLRLKVDVLEKKNRELENRLSTEPPPMTDSEDRGFPLLMKLRLLLADAEEEIERYKAFARAVNFAIEQRQFCSWNAIWGAIAERMEEDGYEIGDEERGIPEFGAGSEDNSEGADEHNFL